MSCKLPSIPLQGQLCSGEHVQSCYVVSSDMPTAISQPQDGVNIRTHARIRCTKSVFLGLENFATQHHSQFPTTLHSGPRRTPRYAGVCMTKVSGTESNCPILPSGGCLLEKIGRSGCAMTLRNVAFTCGWSLSTGFPQPITSFLDFCSCT